MQTPTAHGKALAAHVQAELMNSRDVPREAAMFFAFACACAIGIAMLGNPILIFTPDFRPGQFFSRKLEARG
jgi:hypothetical protein